MIKIAGKTVTASDLSQPPQNGTAMDILAAMSSSAAVFSFETENQLRFELNLRAELVQASKDLARSGIRFAVFRDSTCNADFWDRMPNGGFRLKKDVSPAAAIQDIFRNGRKYGTECATAMMIVLYGALVKVFGAGQFDRLFPKIELMNWRRLDPRLQGFGYLEKYPDYLPGDRRYFANPDVDPLVPMWQGENVVQLGGGLYYGHGVGINDANAIIRSLNGNRSPGADESAYLMDGAGRPDFKKLSALLGQ